MKQTLKKILNRFTPDMFSVVQSVRSRRFIERACASDGRAALARKVAQQVDGKVQDGPFAGMRLDPSVFPQHMTPKLLGTYEDELAPFLLGLAGHPLACVVNIGSAEGYYAVGAARLWPEVEVYSFDLDPVAQRATSHHANLNNVAHRVHILGRATSQNLETLLSSRNPALAIIDCEGAEAVLVDPKRTPALTSCFLLIELHPSAVPDIEKMLSDRLRPTHDIEIVQPRPKTAEAYSGRSWLALLSPPDIPRAFNEYRGKTPWLLARPKADVHA